MHIYLSLYILAYYHLWPLTSLHIYHDVYLFFLASLIPFQSKSVVFPIPLLFVPFFLYRVASLVLTLPFGVFLPFTSLTFVISRSFHAWCYLMPSFWNIIFSISIWKWCFTYPDLVAFSPLSVTILALAPSFVMLMPLSCMSYYSPCLSMALE
jgi:hypothetical protein